MQSGENYHDLGLDQPNDRQLQLIRRLGSEALLKGNILIQTPVKFVTIE